VPNKSGPSPRSVKAVQMEPERLWSKGFVKQMNFESGEKTDGMTDGESDGGDCETVTCAR